jgi:hypothetical protein
MSDAQIAQECRAVLGTKLKSEASIEAIIASSKAATSKKMSDTAKKKYQYTESFAAAGQHLRQMQVSPKQACAYLKEHPYEHRDGTTVVGDPDHRRIVAMQLDKEIGSNSEGQFRKNFMKKSFPDATADGKSLPGATAGGRIHD